MGSIIKHKPVKLIVGLIGKDIFFDKTKKMLVRKFGPFDFESRLIDFNFTDYYEKEMGSELKRKFLSFKRKIPPELLPDIKRYTNEIEKKFATPRGKRQVNIDPGYLNLSKLVLATTKDHHHRLYLGRGIFAEITLLYRNKTFMAWDWTYPDYRSDEYIKVFNYIRNNLLEKRKK